MECIYKRKVELLLKTCEKTRQQILGAWPDNRSQLIVNQVCLLEICVVICTHLIPETLSIHLLAIVAVYSLVS